MSFSSEVKEELSRQLSLARHCQIAELAAIISFCGQIKQYGINRYFLKIHTENITVARKYFTLLQKTFNIKTDVAIKRNAYLKKSRTYIVAVDGFEDTLRLLKVTKFVDDDGQIINVNGPASNLIVQSACCKRSFIRGAFLASGSISDPEKFYHLEIVCTSAEKAEQLRHMINTFSMEAKIVTRKKYYVVYIKEGNQIVDLLNIMEAHKALMNLENVRILKEMRNSINRQVNCETANINKTVSAAVEQINDITYVKEKIGFANLPAGLEEIALARLAMPEATLKELGEALDPPVGKSGVNHRLRKLKNIADSIRENKEDNYDFENYYN